MSSGTSPRVELKREPLKSRALGRLGRTAPFTVIDCCLISSAIVYRAMFCVKAMQSPAKMGIDRGNVKETQHHRPLGGRSNCAHSVRPVRVRSASLPPPARPSPFFFLPLSPAPPCTFCPPRSLSSSRPRPARSLSPPPPRPRPPDRARRRRRSSGARRSPRSRAAAGA
jgi:hypothetical protein